MGESEDCQPHAVRSRRIWLLTNAPSPYQAELLTEIAALGEIDLAVRFMRHSSAAGRAVSSNFGSRVMWSPLPQRCGDELRLHPRAIRDAAFGAYDCFVLSGLYTSVSFLCCAFILTARRKPWVLWLERPRSAHSAASHVPRLRRLTHRIRDWLINHASRILCIGSAAQAAYAQMGVDERSLDLLPYSCDITRYDDIMDRDILDWKDQHGLQNKTTFLFSGQLIHRKGVDTLLSAFARLADEMSDVMLIVLGDGPERASLQSRVRPEHCERIQFLGHLPQSDLPTAFRSADVFVFPSRHDGWAVVINEACAASLPVIASEQTGAAHDLVEDGNSGYRHDAEDVDAFYRSMQRLAGDPRLRKQMGRRSRELVESFTPQRGALRFAESMERAITRR